ncbi:hypothetical protein Psi01_64330 [Planobispora siamensis]|uniref:Uncharacterized protein n=1 Tax=Planobispora siamensis TaxID=936338 RepID=A0A8J3SUE8_9ACTN|nr:hypothetical protein Psi01_64330 [Planobispora siamensis]
MFGELRYRVPLSSMRRREPNDRANSTVFTAKGTACPSPSSSPPRGLPVMTATWKLVSLRASARGSWSRVTREGISVVSASECSAHIAPSTMAAVKRCVIESDWRDSAAKTLMTEIPRRASAQSMTERGLNRPIRAPAGI